MDFDEVLRGRASAFWGSAIVEFVVVIVPCSALLMCVDIPIDYIVHCCSVAKEYSVICIWVCGIITLFRFLGDNAGAKC